MRVVGQEFDPTLHEAVLREPSDAHAEDVVIEELQRGYHQRKVLRHAMVKVSMGPCPQNAPAEAGATPDDSAANEGGPGDGNGWTDDQTPPLTVTFGITSRWPIITSFSVSAGMPMLTLSSVPTAVWLANTTRISIRAWG